MRCQLNSGMGFKSFLLTEDRNYLAEKIGDILTGVHELVTGGKQIGARQLVRHSEGLVTQIRKILHTNWPKTEFKFLRQLQKCGVALMKTIDEKGDLRDTLNSVRRELEQLSGKMGTPINDLGTHKKKQAPPEMPKPPQQPEPQMQSPQEMPPQPAPDGQPPSNELFPPAVK
jgi:hypothetical protein